MPAFQVRGVFSSIRSRGQSVGRAMFDCLSVSTQPRRCSIALLVVGVLWGITGERDPAGAQRRGGECRKKKAGGKR